MMERMDDFPEPDLPISKTFFLRLRPSMVNGLRGRVALIRFVV